MASVFVLMSRGMMDRPWSLEGYVPLEIEHIRGDFWFRYFDLLLCEEMKIQYTIVGRIIRILISYGSHNSEFRVLRSQHEFYSDFHT